MIEIVVIEQLELFTELVFEECSKCLSHFHWCSFEVDDVEVVSLGVVDISDQHFLPVGHALEDDWLADDEVEGVRVGATGCECVNYEKEKAEEVNHMKKVK